MDSGSFTNSSKEAFLPKYQIPKATRSKLNLKTLLPVLLLLLLLVATFSSILSSICKRKIRHIRLKSYEPDSTRYFCHLTIYRTLCLDSMSSIINTTELINNGPDLIFSTSLKVAINQLNNVTISLTKRIPLKSSSNASLVVDARMSDCRTWVRDSLGRLNQSLSTLSLLTDFESLTYMSNLKSAVGKAYQCLVALKGIGDGEGTSSVGVEEAKVGVEKAWKYIVNSVGLLDKRETILSYFYDPLDETDEDYDYDGYYYYYGGFDYRFIVCLYSAMYMTLALMFFLLWKTS